MPRIYDSRVKRLGVAGAWAALYETFVIRRGPDECWDWSGARHPYGYGHMNIWQVGSRRAHQVAYELAYGAIPPGCEIMHLCHQPACTNPAHLEAGTRRRNMETSRIVGRLDRKIPLADIARLRERRRAGETLDRIARDYGCTKQAVRFRLRSLT
jgi:HNH endonuclease